MSGCWFPGTRPAEKRRAWTRWSARPAPWAAGGVRGPPRGWIRRVSVACADGAEGELKDRRSRMKMTVGGSAPAPGWIHGRPAGLDGAGEPMRHAAIRCHGRSVLISLHGCHIPAAAPWQELVTLTSIAAYFPGRRRAGPHCGSAHPASRRTTSRAPWYAAYAVRDSSVSESRTSHQAAHAVAVWN